MEFTPIRPIEPLWESTRTAPQESVTAPAGSMFADVFRQAIQNVRDTNAEQVNLEYQLATGQIDNPALLNVAITKATTAAELLMQIRNEVLDAYSELTRISL